MPKSRYIFRRTDLMRAIKAAHDFGLGVCKIRINPQGEIEVEAGAPPAQDLGDDLERWLSKRAKQNNAHSP